MKEVLWTQNESPDIPDTIVVDGIECKDPILQQEAFNLLNSINQELSISPKVRDKLFKKFNKKGFSHQANYKLDKEGVYLQGCFQQEDNVGRKLPYMFFDKDAKNIIEASITLNRTAKIIGRTCNNEELDILAKYSRLGSKKKWLTILGAIIFTLILVILIITLK